MSIFQKLAVVFALAAIGSCTRPATAFTNLYVFGDSLSDMGNVDNNTLGFFPISPYFDGRFSNGLVYTELLAQRLGVSQFKPSTDGGTNYAHGGAKTEGNWLDSLSVIDDVEQQATEFAASGPADPDALYIVWAGANDLFDGQTNVQAVVNNINETLVRLYVAGAREFLVPNLPHLGLTPAYSGSPAVSQEWTDRTKAFNVSLEADLAGLESVFTDATYRRLNTAALFNAAIDSPATFGLTNVTSPAAPGLEASDLVYFGSVVSNPDEYLFWDEVHPTRTGHELLSQAAYRAASRPGDFNYDGKVDMQDYGLWRSAYGSISIDIDGNGDFRVDAIDYAVWRENLDPPIAGTAAFAPEPTSLALLTVFLSAARGRRFGRRAKRA